MGKEGEGNGGIRAQTRQDLVSDCRGLL